MNAYELMCTQIYYMRLYVCKYVYIYITVQTLDAYLHIPSVPRIHQSFASHFQKPLRLCPDLDNLTIGIAGKSSPIPIKVPLNLHVLLTGAQQGMDRNGTIVSSYYGSFPHYLLSTSKFDIFLRISTVATSLSPATRTLKGYDVRMSHPSQEPQPQRFNRVKDTGPTTWGNSSTPQRHEISLRFLIHGCTSWYA